MHRALQALVVSMRTTGGNFRRARFIAAPATPQTVRERSVVMGSLYPIRLI
jgi:hypothetical protein